MQQWFEVYKQTRQRDPSQGDRTAESEWVYKMIEIFMCDHKRAVRNEQEKTAQAQRQFLGGRVPSRHAQSCEDCGRSLGSLSLLLMAFIDNGEAVRQNYLKTMTDNELMDLANSQPSEDKLPFINLAWQNKQRSMRQFCFRCYGARFQKL